MLWAWDSVCMKLLTLAPLHYGLQFFFPVYTCAIKHITYSSAIGTNALDKFKVGIIFSFVIYRYRNRQATWNGFGYPRWGFENCKWCCFVGYKCCLCSNICKRTFSWYNCLNNSYPHCNFLIFVTFTGNAQKANWYTTW